MRSNMLLPLFALAFSSPGFGAEQHTLTVKVTRITDGDTIKAIDSNRLEHDIRLLGIDAPESEQAFSARSKQNLERLVAGKDVRIEWSKDDGYGRLLAIVRLPISAACEPPVCRDGYLDVNLCELDGPLEGSGSGTAVGLPQGIDEWPGEEVTE